MANCTVKKFIGRSVGLEYVTGCGDAVPTGGWLTVGALNTKAFTIGTDTVDATADDNTDNIKEMLATYLNYAISGDGKAKATAASNQAALIKYLVDEMKAGLQPTAWLRVTMPDITIVAFMLITDPGSRSAPNADTVTFTFAAEVTATDTGVDNVIVTDTP